jgi:SRSO17 transposase
MIPIFEIPSFITEFIHNTENLSYHTKKHMSRYATGLIVSGNKTITAMNENFTDRLSSRSMNRFLVDQDWNDSEINRKRIQELQEHNETRWSVKGVGIIDDSIIEKTGKSIPFSGKLYDHSENRYVHGISIVTMHYADRKTNYPIAHSVYRKKDTVKEREFVTKIELAKRLVKEGVKVHKMPVRTFVFDSWYMSKGFTEFIEDLGKDWISRCKSNLLVKHCGKFVSLETFAGRIKEKNFMQTEIEGKKYWVFTRNLFMKSLDKKVRIIISRDEEGNVIYLATNRRDFVVKILKTYALRWKIDAFYKDAKEHLGLGRCQVRDPKGMLRHFSMVFLSHTLLKLGVVEGKLSKLCSTVGKSIKSFLFGMLEKLVYEVFSKGEKVVEVLKVLNQFK